MAKKKITPGMLGGKKKKLLDVNELEDAVSKIHEKQSKVPSSEELTEKDNLQKSVIIQKDIEESPVIEEKPKIRKESKKKEKSKSEVSKPVRFSFNMTKDLHRKFKIYCLEKDITMSDEILTMIQKTVFKSKR